MIELNPDYKYIKEACPAYIPVFHKYNDNLRRKFGLELGMELDDHTDTKLRFWLSKPYQREKKESHPEAQNLIEKLEKQLDITCSQCGCDIDVSLSSHYRHTHHYLNQMVLCETCHINFGKEEWKLASSSYQFLKNGNQDIRKAKPLGPEVRFIDGLETFSHAGFGSYFFYKNQLYVKPNTNPQVKIEEEILQSPFGKRLFIKGPVIKAYYAGHNTGFRDDSGRSVFTGDIIRLKGSHVENRDPSTYDGKDLYIPRFGDHQYEVYGVVSCSSICNYAYQVVLDNHGAFLCHASELEILGNIFYNLDPDHRIDIWGAGCSLAQSGYDPKGFWNQHSRDSIKEDLKYIKTPSFSLKQQKIAESKILQILKKYGILRSSKSS